MSNAADPPIVGLAGCGVTGSRVAAHLLAGGLRVAVHDPAFGVPGSRVVVPKGAVRVERPADLLVADLVVLCQPRLHRPVVVDAIRAGVPVVSLGDDLDDVRSMAHLDGMAREHDAFVVVGAGMAPGLSGLLARMLAGSLDVVDEVHVAVHGTAGPECARQHHDALGSRAYGWHDGSWVEPLGGSGRELVWFPEPIGAHDCYRAAMADPLLLQRAFPSAERISARMSATRRDRLTARLPMLTPPHPSGDLGAVRVEVRGALADGARETVIAGAAGMTADLASAVCAATVLEVLAGSSAGTAAGPASGPPSGVHSLADAALEPFAILHRATSLGVAVQEFTGLARITHW